MAEISPGFRYLIAFGSTPVSYPVGIGALSSGIKTTEVWSLPHLHLVTKPKCSELYFQRLLPHLWLRITFVASH